MHIQTYEFKPRSYRDLPVRIAEIGSVYRYEKSGELNGLLRVRGFTQDDAHILLAPDQIRDEVVRISQLFDEVYNLFKLPYTIELSTMPEDHMGTKEEWDKATKSLSDAIRRYLTAVEWEAIYFRASTDPGEVLLPRDDCVDPCGRIIIYCCGKRRHPRCPSGGHR